eukprot:Sspe_Gene.1040::Locus_352_Transcript_1_1_Confidence_1.000_Length_1859::g.1040::m.1040
MLQRSDSGSEQERRTTAPIPPSAVQHPANRRHMPHNTAPGPVGTVYRLVKQFEGDIIGWELDPSCVVTRITPGKAADIAQVRTGMRIMEINGHPVFTSEEAKAALSVGTVFNVVLEGAAHNSHGMWEQVVNPGGTPLWRNRVTNEESFEHPESRRLPPGIEEVLVQKKPGEGLGMEFRDLLLVRVRPGTPADTYGLEKYVGWRLTHINRQRVHTVADIKKHTSENTSLWLRFEVEEVTVRKYPGEEIGCEMVGTTVQAVVPGSPAEQAGVGKHVGERITHVNGVGVLTGSHILARSQNCDSVRLRFQATEITVHKKQNEPLGIELDNLVLQRCRPDSPLKSQGIGRFVGRRLIRVNGHPVHTTDDVSQLARDSNVTLEFQDTVTATEQAFPPPPPAPPPPPSGMSPIGTGSYTVRDDVFDSGPAVLPHSISTAPRYHSVVSPLIQTPTNVRTVSPPRIDNLLAELSEERRNRKAGEQAARIAMLEERVAELEELRRAPPPPPPPAPGPPRPQVAGPPPWERAARHPTAAPPHMHPADKCYHCGGAPEIDCFDCHRAYCRRCCLLAHRSGRLRLTHTRMASRTSPATSAPLDISFFPPA